MADLDTEYKRRFAAGEEPPSGLTDEQKRRWLAGIYPFGVGETTGDEVELINNLLLLRYL